MDTMNWVQLITAILAGLATAIPLVAKLVVVVKAAVKQQNWNELLKMTMNYMTEAEKNISSGAERKEWVMSMVKASAVNVNYDLTDEDIKKLSDLIDAICAASKELNAKTTTKSTTKSK